MSGAPSPAAAAVTAATTVAASTSATPTPSEVSDALLDLPDIVRVCCESFDENGEADDEFARDIFMIGEWFVENTELMAQFLDLYQQRCDAYGLKVCVAVSFWIRHFPSQFDAHPPLCALVNRLRAMTARDARVDDVLGQELDISSVPSYAWLRNVSVRNPASRHLSLAFEQWSPVDLANALAYIDYRVLSRVSIYEVKKYVKLSKLRQTPILERSIAVFNSISCWVQCMILSKSTAQERAAIMTKFINVGKHLCKQCNFNTLMAVVGGVTHSSIGRLAKTQVLLAAQVRKELDELTQLLSTPNNFANYRRVLKESRCCAARIPIMGIHLKDLIAWCNKNNADQFERTARVSRRRIHQLANLLGYFIGINRIAASLLPDPNMDLINTLKVSFDISYNENDIYELSVKREARAVRGGGASSSGASTPSADAPPVVFADWASGVCQTPDPETVNKHISAMVDAVFKHYDHDRNEYISRSEFQQIAGNFPYNLDSFVRIDADHDGQISKTEMKNYFLELNKQSSEFRSGFQHNFQETTFLTPTVCSHCKKMLWGLIKQGLKCRDCALIVHDACKRLAIAECRRALTTTTTSTRQRTQSNGSEGAGGCGSPTPPPLAAAASSSVTAAVAGTVTVVGVNAVASGANILSMNSAPDSSSKSSSACKFSNKSGASTSAISMGTLYEWLVNSSPQTPNASQSRRAAADASGSEQENRRSTQDEATNSEDRDSRRTLRRDDAKILAANSTTQNSADSEQQHMLAGSANETSNSPQHREKNRFANSSATATHSPIATRSCTPIVDSPAVSQLIIGGFSTCNLPASSSVAQQSSSIPSASLSAIAVEGLIGVRSAFRSSFHRLLRSSKKYRSVSETTDNSSDGASPSRTQNFNSPSSLDCARLTTTAVALQQQQKIMREQQQKEHETGRPMSPRMRQQASLASEEVFCDDDAEVASSCKKPTHLIKTTATRTPNEDSKNVTTNESIISNGSHYKNLGALNEEEKFHQKMKNLTKNNAKLREEFRRNSASLSPIESVANFPT